MTASISVVIPVRNGAATLPHQLQALTAACKGRNVEVVVADNGSTDGTAGVANAYADRLNIRVVDAGRRPGINVARNDGVRAAVATRILLCDADDEVDPDWVAAMGAAFDRGATLVGGRIDYRRLNTATVQAWRGASGTGPSVVMDFLPTAHGACMAFTRALYWSIDGFDEDFLGGGDDVDFCWRAQLAGHKLVDQPDAVVHYRLRTSLKDQWRQSRAYGRSEALLFRKFREQGIQRRLPTTVSRDFWWLLTRAPFAVPRARRGAWLRRLAEEMGRLEGAVHHRVWWW